MSGASIAGGTFEWSKLTRSEEADSEKKGLLLECTPDLKRQERRHHKGAMLLTKRMRQMDYRRTFQCVVPSCLIFLVMKPGQLVAFVGRVGSGKSVLIHVVLGEMRKLKSSPSHFTAPWHTSHKRHGYSMRVCEIISRFGGISTNV